MLLDNKCTFSPQLDYFLTRCLSHTCADPKGERDRGSNPPPGKIQNIGFLSNNGPNHLKNHKVTKTAFNV